MAKKKKQSAQRNKHRQQKQQRRENRVAKRHVSTQRPIATDTVQNPMNLSIVSDLKRIVMPVQGEPLNVAGLEQLFEIAYGSDSLIDEPEFEDIAVDPLLAMTTHVNIAMSEGLALPEQLDKLDDKHRIEMIAKLYDLTNHKLFDDALRQQVIEALNRLRQRLRAAKRTDDLEVAAATQFLLTNDPNSEIGHTTGIVRALVQRAIDLGFELSQALEQVYPEAESLSALDLHNRIAQLTDDSTLLSLVQKTGLGSALSKQVEASWDAAEDAILNGRLNLAIYSESELASAVTIVNDLNKKRRVQEGDRATKTFVEHIFSALTEYLKNLFTAERVALLKARVEEIVKDPKSGQSPHALYLINLHEDLQKEFEFEVFRVTLFKTLVGELGLLQSDTESDEEDNEEVVEQS